MHILAGYTSSICQDFESHLRMAVDLAENDIRETLDDYKSIFITFEIPPGIYTSNYFSAFLLRNFLFEYEGVHNTVDNDLDDLSTKPKFVVRPSIIALRYDEISVFRTTLGFKPHWDCKHYNEYISQKIIKISAINNFHLRCDVFDGPVVNVLRQHILLGFVLYKYPG